mgnify:FL=1
MADTTSPKKDNNTAVSDIGRPDGSSHYGTANKDTSALLRIFQQQAIAEDKHKRLIKATADAFEQQLANGNIRKN